MDGLIIKKKWLEKLFLGKYVELRSTNCKKHFNRRIALICSGTGLIYGDAYLTHSVKFRDEEHFKNLFELHKFDGKMPYKTTWGWCLSNRTKYNYKIPYNHPKGAVVWVKNVL